MNWNPENRDTEDSKACSVIEWLKPNVLIALMKKQRIRFQQGAMQMSKND